MKTRLNHVRANVQDLESAIDWYTSVLGFEVESRWPPDQPNYAHFITGEGATFGIMVETPVPCGARFNFNVDDVDDAWERLRTKAKVVEPLFETEYGSRKFTIEDPDGNELGFIQS